MITENNIYKHEFIGLETQVIQSSNPQFIGLNGTITDETKSMFTLNTNNGKKSIPKSNSLWKFYLQGKQVTLDGSKIEKRPFDRLGGKA
ncbi:MAG: ribonuclease P protein subunit [Nitrosopumilaceae archaeon]|jgi:ribonuclease P protein subunit POP4